MPRQLLPRYSSTMHHVAEPGFSLCRKGQKQVQHSAGEGGPMGGADAQVGNHRVR